MDRNQHYEKLRQEGFRLYEKRDGLAIQKRRLADFDTFYSSLLAQIQQTVEETEDSCKGGRSASLVREAEETYRELKTKTRQQLTSYDRQLAADSEAVEDLIAKNIAAKGQLFD